MNSLEIICVGKLKTPGVSEVCQHFSNRIRQTQKIEWTELKSTSTSQEHSSILEALEKRKSRKGVVIALDEMGRSMTTENWGKQWKDWSSLGINHMIWIIGGSYGLNDEIRNQSDLVANLGQQTLSHELARVVLLEQIYRIGRLLAGHPYHH